LGLKINFSKSELFYFGKAKDVEDDYINLFDCVAGTFPFRYLGTPIHFCKLKLGNGSLLKIGLRANLQVGWENYYHMVINSNLTSLPMFMLSFFEIAKGVWKRLQIFRSCFLAK
jgi:hypothetical protein